MLERACTARHVSEVQGQLVVKGLTDHYHALTEYSFFVDSSETILDTFELHAYPLIDDDKYMILLSLSICSLFCCGHTSFL